MKYSTVRKKSKMWPLEQDLNLIERLSPALASHVAPVNFALLWSLNTFSSFPSFSSSGSDLWTPVALHWQRSLVLRSHDHLNWKISMPLEYCGEGIFAHIFCLYFSSSESSGFLINRFGLDVDLSMGKGHNEWMHFHLALIMFLMFHLELRTVLGCGAIQCVLVLFIFFIRHMFLSFSRKPICLNRTQ